jgi:hypothetical protein
MHLAARRQTVFACAATALAAAAIAATPAVAAGPPGPGCPAAPTVQPFTAWQDVADYVLAPDGGLEAGGAGWSLVDGARVVEGNASFAVGGPTDHRSLELPAGSSATTAPICIGSEHRTMRFFVNGPSTGQLSVQAIYTVPGGRAKTVPLGNVGGAGSWAPSEVLPMRVNELAPEYGNALQVALRFTPRGARGWSIDDVYVDPYRVR